jgi:hypothetical protein
MSCVRMNPAESELLHLFAGFGYGATEEHNTLK